MQGDRQEQGQSLGHGQKQGHQEEQGQVQGNGQEQGHNLGQGQKQGQCEEGAPHHSKASLEHQPKRTPRAAQSVGNKRQPWQARAAAVPWAAGE